MFIVLNDIENNYQTNRVSQEDPSYSGFSGTDHYLAPAATEDCPLEVSAL